MNILLNLVGGDWYYNPYGEFSLTGAFVILLALGFILVLSWFIRKKPLSFKISEKQKLENYILNFDSTSNEGEGEISLKQVSLLTKIILIFLALMISFIPLSEFIKTIPIP